MNQSKMNEMENRIEELEKVYKRLQSDLHQLQSEVDSLEQGTKHTTLEKELPSSQNKLTYLMEVNEQMFQQNVRLRQLIELCIESEAIPTFEQYYQALKGDD